MYGTLPKSGNNPEKGKLESATFQRLASLVPVDPTAATTFLSSPLRNAMPSWLCQHPDGCQKKAQDKQTMRCVKHGGGRRCEHPECTKLMQRGTKLCIAHGGGKRCEHPDGCDKSALGSTSLCAAHGGGKRCEHPDGCNRAARGSTRRCIAHGDNSKRPRLVSASTSQSTPDAVLVGAAVAAHIAHVVATHVVAVNTTEACENCEVVTAELCASMGDATDAQAPLYDAGVIYATAAMGGVMSEAGLDGLPSASHSNFTFSSTVQEVIAQDPDTALPPTANAAVIFDG
jgi:hypothetical protein